MEYWNDTVTVFHKTQTASSESWKRTVISGAFWKSTVIKTAQGTSLSMASSFLVRLLVGAEVSEGDVIVKGAVEDVIGGELTIAKLLNKYKDRSFRVRHYSDNSRHDPAHQKCEG